MSELLAFREFVKEVGKCKICEGQDADNKVLIISIGKQTLRICERCREKLVQLLIDIAKEKENPE